MKLTELFSDPLANREDGRVRGVVIGLVTNNVDPEKLGRVKVRFPWLSENDESYWARIATLMAGLDRGSFFLPEIDDEVLVAFEHGDIRFPYIIGMLWNGVDQVPYHNSNKRNNLRVIRSRSKHELVFDDNESEKKEKVVLHSRAGHHLTLDDSHQAEKITLAEKKGKNFVEVDSVTDTTTLQNDKKIHLKDSKDANYLEIDAAGKITSVAKSQWLAEDLASNNQILIHAGSNTVSLSAQQKVVIKDKTDSNSIVLEASGRIRIASMGTVSIDATRIQLNAKADFELQSGGTLTINGAIVNIN